MDWKKQFKEPPRKYAVYPIIHSRVAEAEKHIDAHVRQGFGGVVGNINYTPEFPHDTKAWDDVINGLLPTLIVVWARGFMTRKAILRARQAVQCWRKILILNPLVFYV